MKFRFGILAATMASAAVAGTLPPETPLIVEGPVKVEAADFEGALLRAPEKYRLEVRATYDRVSTMVDGIFITRMLAERAKAAGIDKDPAVQKRMQQVQEGVLADLYMKKVEAETPIPNLEQRARELYRADPSKYSVTEHVHIQQILVGLNGRTRDMALQRAKEVYEEAKSSKEDFLVLVHRLSDDPDKKRTRGDLGYNSPTTFAAPITEALKKMSKPGEISEPIESEFGFHIIRFVDRKPAKTLPFEEVRKVIIDAEKERILKKRAEDIVQEIRGSKSVVIHPANVQALVTPIDPAIFQKKLDEAAAAAK